LKGGIPARAANVVYNTNVSYPEELLEKIASALAAAGMF
jgi:intraflagellar transport protein 172